MPNISPRASNKTAATTSTSRQTSVSKCSQILGLTFMLCLLVIHIDRQFHYVNFVADTCVTPCPSIKPVSPRLSRRREDKTPPLEAYIAAPRASPNRRPPGEAPLTENAKV